ncbi:putative translation protein, beta-barrel domain superfamily [Helianthus annuus]|nr:putative translation protein, beta-barrel domain superfamily [Helianthus annuus]
MLRMVVHTATDDPCIITARVISGCVVTNLDLFCYPGSWSTKVEAIRLNGREVAKVTTGERVELVVKGPLDDAVKRGCVLSASRHPVKEVLAFTAEILVVDPTSNFTEGAE